jgi:adenylate kinase family enzyme
MNKPLIIYVSGAPGSGKTTLARLLANELYIPSISSDTIHGGVAFSNPEHNRRQTLLKIFIPTMIEMSKNGISFVVDQVLQKGISEVDIIDKLRPYAEIINVHTVCDNPIERYKSRIIQADSSNIIERREYLLERAEHHKDNLDRTGQPLELELPLLVVNTNNGYNPNLGEIIEFVRTNYEN